MTWSYNSEGRGLSSEHAGGVAAVALTYNADGTRTVANPLGKAFKYSFATIGKSGDTVPISQNHAVITNR